VVLVLFAKYNYNDQVKEDEMGRACSMNGGQEECIQDFGGKARRKDLDASGRIILKWIFEK
jgi:hypothetical protein